MLDLGFYPSKTEPVKEFIYSTPAQTLFALKVYTHQAIIRQYVDKTTNIVDTNETPDNTEEKTIDVYNGTYMRYINKNSRFRTKEDFCGRTMEIMVNTNYIAKTLENYTDIKTGDISFYDFLDKLLSGLQNALGNINRFSLSYNEDKNEFKIIDSTFIPGLGNVATGNPFSLTDYEFKLDYVRANAYHTRGFYTDNAQQDHRSSFVRDFSIKTKLSNNFAAMTTIGAQANGNVVGEDATALSKWNVGLVDRLNKVKKNDNDPNIEEEIEKTYLSNCAILQILNTRVNDGNITNEQIDGSTNPGVDLFKYEIGKYVHDNKINPIGFLPIDLELTMDGLSGMKIYELFNVDQKYLPQSYQDSIQFITTGISHKIQNNDWTTTINSICGPKYDPFNSPKANKPKKVKVKTLKKSQTSESGGSISKPASVSTGAYQVFSAGVERKKYWDVSVHHDPKKIKIYTVTDPDDPSTKHDWRVSIRTGGFISEFNSTIKARSKNKEHGCWDIVLKREGSSDVDFIAPFDGKIVGVKDPAKFTDCHLSIESLDGQHGAVFLHMRQLYLTNIGDTFKKGDKLGVQGNQGYGSQGVHLHVEEMTPEEFADYFNQYLEYSA